MVWLVLDTKNTWSGLGKDHGALVTTNMTENYPKVTLKWFQKIKMLNFKLQLEFLWSFSSNCAVSTV